MADDQRQYLDRIRALSFETRDWTPSEIEEMRDFLSPWNHNIRLADGLYTVFHESQYPAHRAIMEVVDHHLAGAYEGSTVLDLGCLEGYFSLECARHGAEVVGVDAKETNIKKCEFVKSVLRVPNLQLVLDDAMNVTKDRYGSFDVVLALGLLYHLDDPFRFMAQVADLCDNFLVLDTLVALEDAPQTIDGWQPQLSDLHEVGHSGRRYRGRLYREYEDGADEVERAFSTTASQANDLSLWLTEDSLVSLLDDVGFEQLEKVVSPARAESWWSEPSYGRVLYVARRRSQFVSRVFDT